LTAKQQQNQPKWAFRESQADMPALLQAENLTKSFAGKVAVGDVSLTVHGGEVVGILGPNGAGKTTTLRMATGFLVPTSGRTLIGGHDVASDSLNARRQFGYLPEGSPLYSDMTVSGLLMFVARARGIPASSLKPAIAAAVRKLELGDVLGQTIDTLSKGFKRRVGMAQAILHDPSLLILDEPTDGLDPNQKRSVRALIKNMGTEKAVLISTHILEEVEAVCSRVVVIAKGRIVADGTPAVLRAQSRYAHAVTVNFAPGTIISSAPDDWTLEQSVLPDGRVQLTFLSADAAPILLPVLQKLEQANLHAIDVVVEAGRLEDVFQRLTQETAVAA
jgi:ABC-2 type transport system ATP-binding protein